jgi:hypothetical protein
MHPKQAKNKANPMYQGTCIAPDGKEIAVYADPYYGDVCEVCGQRPIVRIRYADSDRIYIETGMCGPCTFGEAACLDPAEWI